MEKRTQRSPEELIVEQEQKLERMRMRQARKDAMSNPGLNPLIEEKTALAKEIREAKKLLGNGPQSANARIEKHQIWIYKIEKDREDAEMILESAQSRLEQIEAEISDYLSSLTDSKKEIEAEG
jgi:hypothetical protein